MAGIDSDLNEFLDATNNLSGAVNGAGVSWSDAQFERVSRAVKDLAAQSSSVMSRGYDFLDRLDRFFELGEE